MSTDNGRFEQLREQIQLFDSETADRRRSVLFAMAIMAGFLSTAATSAVITSSQHLPTILLLSLFGCGAFVFAGFVYAGRFNGLVSDEEILWRVFEDAE